MLVKSGTIQSRGYPQHYPPHLHCEWLLQAEEDQVVELNITSIEMESEDGLVCKHINTGLF